MRPQRLSAFLVLTALLTTTARAQIPKGVLAEVIETHKASILRYLDAAPDSMMGFRTTPGVRTFAEQIEHAAGADAFIAHMAIAGNMNVPSFGDTAVIRRNKTALRAYVVASMDHTIGMLKGVSDASLSEPVTMMGMTKPRYRFLVELLDHFPWTLGQTVPYLRMNGVTPPAYTPF
jgi:DinB superfamily